MNNTARMLALLLLLSGLSGCAEKSPGSSNAVFLVFFDEFSAAIEPDAKDTVRQAAAEAIRRHTTNIRIEARANATGTPDATMKIAVTRAAVVRDMLVADGVSPATLQLVPLGQRGTEDTGVGPRRVDIILKN